MKKSEVVKNNRDFDRIIQKGQLKKNNEFIIYYDDNNLEINRFGISVGKKIGNAVTRNYYKRVIRNICDNTNFLYSKGKDYIIIMRKGCKDLEYLSISNSFANLIKKIENQEKEQKNEKTN